MNRLLALVALVGLLATGGCSRSPSGEIERVLNACAKQADYVNSVDAPHDKKAAYLADKMQEIDTRGCPKEFRIAFQQHINAWRAASVAFAQNTGGNLLMESVASGLTGDSSYLGAAQRNSNEALPHTNSFRKSRPPTGPSASLRDRVVALKAMNSQKSSSKAEAVYLLIGYGVVIGVVTVQIKAGEGTWFTWSVLVFGGYYFLRTLDRLRR